MAKKLLGMNVLEASRQRIAWCFDNFDRIYVSFSGGKDSTVMTHIVCDEAKRRRKKIGLLFIDLEGQYKLTIDHVREMFDMYSEIIDPYWICLPLNLRNAVSVYEPQWMCWQSDSKRAWVRDMPIQSISDPSYFQFFRVGMEFEEFVPEFGKWFADGKSCCCFVGIRSDESLNRWRTIATNRKSQIFGKKYLSWQGGPLHNCYPIYDWSVRDIWRYHAKTALPYNRLYDRMHQAGLTLSQMRICQPYGDDQRRGLWLFHVIEPETWSRIVARVSGANSGSMYIQESGNMTGYRSISRPDGHTWESFAKMLLASMPEKTRTHYEDKISVFLHWWKSRGVDVIPDESPPDEEAERRAPSWRRICKALLRNDYWCKGLSFSQHKTTAFLKYQKLMKRRREQWGMMKL